MIQGLDDFDDFDLFHRFWHPLTEEPKKWMETEINLPKISILAPLSTWDFISFAILGNKTSEQWWSLSGMNQNM